MSSHPKLYSASDGPPQEPVLPANQTHVLVVEDEPKLRDLLVRAIPDMGFPVVGARTAEDALRVMLARPCAIIIADLKLPEMDGLTLVERVRQSWPLTQVIVMTGFGSLASAKRAIRLDVIDFLTKPCHLGELEQSIERARQRLPRPTLLSIETIGTTGSANGQTDQHAFGIGSVDPKKPMTLEEVKRRHIVELLRRNRYNRAAAAAELGMSTRSLYYHLAQMDAETLEEE